jgi:glycosyltransferase involved in cell wall biosynthesis
MNEMNDCPRVALFADTFYETNGAANVIRRLRAFALENDLPFLCVCAGDETRLTRHGNALMLELKRGKLSFPIDGKLKFDPFLWRYKNLISETLADFQPDVLHVTGLNDVSQLGFFFAHFRRVSAVASWHTNAHEYAASRLAGLMPRLPEKLKNGLSEIIERTVWRGFMKAHFLAQVQLAPNEELVRRIQKMTRRPTFLMSRGVDTELFASAKRRRCPREDLFVIGYVGRLRPEKNVRFLAEVDAALQKANVKNYEFVIVGEGGEERWLKENLSRARLTGVLHGEELARVYADMDLFVFPSNTDAFGNVVLEAMSSGVPAIVMPSGGPKFLIEHERNGYVARDEQDFISAVVAFAAGRKMPPEMREAARAAACRRSWKAVFEQVYQNYRHAATLDKNVRA